MKTPRRRDIRAMNDRLAEQRRQSDERAQAAAMPSPLIIPAGKRVIEVTTTELPQWHETRLDVVVIPDAEVITRSGDPSVIYAMSLQAAELMREAL